MEHDTLDLDLPESHAELVAHQNERRVLAVKQAKKSPLLSGGLDGIDPDTAIDPEVWSRIPILDKERLRSLSPKEFYNNFCLNMREDVCEYWRSGGSTGKPLFYPRTSTDIRYGLTVIRRVLDLAGATRSDIAHMAMPLGIHPVGHLLARGGIEAGVGMVWAGGGNTLPSEAQVDLICEFEPTVLICMASYAIQLANLARSRGIDMSQSTVTRIITSAEPLSAVKRKTLSEFWGAAVYDCYGMTEAMMLGGERDGSDGFVFFADYCYPEVLHPDTLEPVSEGEAGLLVVTPLVTNNATPFIRWNTGDIVTLKKQQVSGSGYDLLPLVKHTHRTAGFVKVRGINIGFGDLEDLLFASNLVSDFRAEIHWTDSRDELKILVEVKSGVSQTQCIETIDAEIRRVFGLKPILETIDPGSVAKSFEGVFKPSRIQDLRG